jgi:hypothetical protein
MNLRGPSTIRSRKMRIVQHADHVEGPRHRAILGVIYTPRQLIPSSVLAWRRSPCIITQSLLLAN